MSSKRGATTVSIRAGDGPVTEFGSIEEFGERVDQVVESLTSGASASADGEARRAGQAAFALCATCVHTQTLDHPGDGPCQVSWFTPEKVQLFCPCREFWPIRPQLEDGLSVLSHEISFGGSVSLVLNRREPTELWDSLSSGRHVTVTMRLEVDGKGFKAVRDHGALVGLAEVRKLRAERVVWEFEDDELDGETGELR